MRHLELEGQALLVRRSDAGMHAGHYRCGKLAMNPRNSIPLRREPAREAPQEPDDDADDGGRRAKGRADEDEEDEEEARRGSGRGAGGSGAGGGPRDYAAERRAEMEAMKDAAVNKSYGRVNAKPEVGPAQPGV